MKSHSIQVQKTARYFTIGEDSPQVEGLWFVVHGYGQLGEFFLKNFAPVAASRQLVVAPEGLSRFYLGENKWERVGASWMTKVDRLAEIRDHVAYLDQLASFLETNFQTQGLPLTLLGFSQGVATIWRWLKMSEIQPDHLVLWAGSIPQEMNEVMEKKLQKMKVWVVYGTRDVYIKEDKAEEQISNLRKFAPDLEVIKFDDGHRINEGALQRLIQAMGLKS